MSGTSWSERLLGGLRRTSERLGENLAGLTGKSRLDDDDLDRIEEALITADLGRLAALRPGQTLRFAYVSAAEGARIARAAEAETRALLAAVRALPADGIDLVALYTGNLVDGVVHALGAEYRPLY